MKISKIITLDGNELVDILQKVVDKKYQGEKIDSVVSTLESGSTLFMRDIRHIEIILEC